MRLEAAITGNLNKFMAQQKSVAEAAVTAGVTEITDRIKTDLREQVVSAGLGDKLAKSWQAKLYPKRKKSINATGWIFCKASKLIRAFNDGVLIKGKDKLFLAIPTEAAPKRGIGGKRISPANFPEHSLGKLRFVYRPNSISLLVVDGLRANTGKRGGFRKASDAALRSHRGIVTVVMFLLVPQVKLSKRLNYQAVVNRWKPQLSQTILKYWPKVNTNAKQP